MFYMNVSLGNNMAFNDDIKRFNDKVEKAATKIFRGTALSLFGKVILRTPVDTGRLRGNWFATIRKPSDQIDGSAEGYEGVTLRAKLGDSLFLVNNLPYAKVIEDGSSEQAPQGMIKVTVIEYQNVVRENARKHKA